VVLALAVATLGSRLPERKLVLLGGDAFGLAVVLVIVIVTKGLVLVFAVAQSAPNGPATQARHLLAQITGSKRF